MLVHVLFHRSSDAAVPVSITALAEGLRSHDADVLTSATPFGGGPAAVGRWIARLAASWRAERPDIVHSIGLTATRAAIHYAPPGVPIVCTLDERPTNARAERQAAQHTAGVLALSSQERDRWRSRLGAQVPVDTMPLALRPVPAAPQAPQRAVMCLSDAAILDRILESMPAWTPHPLIVVARSGTQRYRQIIARAHQLGVGDRLLWRDPRGTVDVWPEAAMLVAGVESSRHGAPVLAAAARHLPSLASPDEAHLDVVVPGSTGMFIDPRWSPSALGNAIDTTLDPATRVSWGNAAHERSRSGHDPALVGERLLAFYDRVRLPRRSRPPAAQPRLTPDRSRLVAEHLPMGRNLASRYTIGNHNADDLVQVAHMGLVLAARRFDPTRGTEFTAYAKPTIMGELRRYFRDNAWAVRVPRGLQQLALDVHRIEGTGLTDDAAIARELGVLAEEVVQARRAHEEALTSKSLDFPLSDNSSEVLADALGECDRDIELVEQRESLRTVLPRIPQRERQILLMRYFGELSQAEIAERLGVSQVHVSRLLTRTLTILREHLAADAPLPRTWIDERKVPSNGQ